MGVGDPFPFFFPPGVADGEGVTDDFFEPFFFPVTGVAVGESVENGLGDSAGVAVGDWVGEAVDFFELFFFPVTGVAVGDVVSEPLEDSPGVAVGLGDGVGDALGFGADAFFFVVDDFRFLRAGVGVGVAKSFFNFVPSVSSPRAACGSGSAKARMSSNRRTGLTLQDFRVRPLTLAKLLCSSGYQNRDSPEENSHSENARGNRATPGR